MSKIPTWEEPPDEDEEDDGSGHPDLDFEPDFDEDLAISLAEIDYECMLDERASQ